MVLSQIDRMPSRGEMQSLTIRGGDLVLGAGGFETITGTPRVVQDLGLAMREPYGSDRFHPQWGSILDTFVGTVLREESTELVEAEIRRVVRNYIAIQQQQLQRDSAERQRSRFSAGEVVAGVATIAVSRDTVTMRARVDLEMMGRSTARVGVSIQ